MKKRQEKFFGATTTEIELNISTLAFAAVKFIATNKNFQTKKHKFNQQHRQNQKKGTKIN